MNWNRVQIAGRLTRDIETRHTQGGMVVANLGLAINEKRKGEEHTTFVDCVAFHKVAELLQKHVKKGSPLFISGRLNFSSWESNDGSKRSKLEVVVDDFQFLGGDREGQEGERNGARRTTQPSKQASHDDIPF